MSEHEERLARILGDINQASGVKLSGKIDHHNQSINGCVNGNNDMTVTIGAMEQLDDDEIAVLVGHEAGHAIEKHCKKKGEIITGTAETLKTIWRNKRSGFVKKTLKTTAVVGVVTVGESFLSRCWERQADSLGAELAEKVGYDPAAEVTLFEKIGAGGSSGGGLFDSHPATAERIETARQKYGERRQLPEPEGSNCSVEPKETYCSGCWCEDCGDGDQCAVCTDGDLYQEHPCHDCVTTDCEGCESIDCWSNGESDKESCEGCFCNDCSGGQQCKECSDCSNFRLDPEVADEDDDEEEDDDESDDSDDG
jgi:putative metalloprotease